MDREDVLVVLALYLCGPLAIACGAVPTKQASLTTGWELEQYWWRRMWLPVLPAVLVIATLAGWAMQEPDETDEVVSRLAVFFALVFALIWVRAAIRATRALLRIPGGAMTAATVGILWPRVFISPQLMQMVDDPDVVAAAREHEAAHARHADRGAESTPT